jgi:phage tail P2-like protein
MSLLPPNSSDQERAMEAATQRATELPAPQRTLWNADTCPANLLPWLAWGFSVDEWNANWTEEQKRRVIAASIDVHRRKGTVGAVRSVLESLGIGSAFQEWWQQTPPGTPHTFKLLASFITTPANVQDSIFEAVNRVKPVRSQMVVELVQGFLGEVNTVGILNPTLYDRLEGAASYP